MATLSRSESRRLYSWWWDSHNSPKNSKWLHDNLTDMDTKVKSMIKLIEEDADSFARRAEMYYKKRPELMKLVEEFYRAYRALAERYNHATLELRHAHRTIAKAFPDQVPLELENGPHTPEIKSVARVLFDSDDDEGDLEVGTRKTGLKQLNNEARCLRKALADMKGEKEEVLVKYQNCLVKLSDVQRELDCAEKDSIWLSEKASRAEIEVKTLKETLVHLDAAKIETQILKDGISRLELDKERVFIQNNEFLEKKSVLENVISVMENEARILKIQAEESENEVFELKKSLADLNEEKEKSTLQYKCCLETISKLEKDISNANEDTKRLTNDVLVENLKFEACEEKCKVLEMSNLSLRAEANNLTKKIAVKDRELFEKQNELESVRRNLHDEHLRCTQIEATFGTLQNVHSKSRDDQRDLAMELENALRMLNALEISKNESQISMENMQNEIKSLKEINERLETKVLHHVGLSDSLQREILRLKEEIERLSGSYRDLVEQVERAGLSPQSLGPSVKSLHDENLKMKQKCEEESNEKMILLKKLENVENVLVEKVFGASNLNAELENSREKIKSLQESCDFLNAEKVYFVSQLQVITENMHNLLGKNAVLENCLSTSKVELEGLREKSKGLEKICEMLKDERSYLLNEKSKLVFKLESVGRKLEIQEKRFIGLEEKYADLEKEKKSSDCEVEEVKASWTFEKQERKNYETQNGLILIGLENQINLLKEENGCKKKEYEEELEKALKAEFEISILHKFMKDIEEKNYSLIIECQKHVEASKLSEKVISELESENLEQQVEGEMLLDEIERLRLGIYRVFRAVDPECDRVDEIENAGTFVNHIVGSVEGMKGSILEIGNDKEMLLVENSVLLTLLEEFKIVAKNEKDEILEMNERLRSNLIESNHRGDLLESELESLRANQGALSKTCNGLQEAYTREIESLCKVNTNLESKLEAFCFDFEITSSIREVLYENKLHEVTSVYRDFENESASKTCEIEEMRGRICSMEHEINGLKSRLHAYGPVVNGLRDDVALLEHNAVLQAKLKVARNRSQELELLEASTDPETSPTEILPEDQSLVSLKNLHARIKDVGKMIQEANKPMSRRRSSNSKKTESITGEIELLKTGRFLGRDNNNKKKAHANEDTHKLHKIKTKATEVWNGMRMKDIPLDRASNNEKGSFGIDDHQMLELWETGEDGNRNRTRVSCKMTEKDIVYDGNFDPDIEKELGIDMLEVSARISEANKEVSKRRLLERLTSDAQKLENIQTTVEILKTKLETNEKGKKGKNVNFEMVREQLVEAEETVVNLTDTNGQLVRKLRECPSPEGRVSPRRRRVLEQARKGSERIGRLQLELQKIQFIVMKMEDEKKNRGGKMKFFKSKGVVLSDFIYNGKRNSSVKRKKGPLCGCLKPSSSRNIFSP